jgi:hypothetical protein
LDILRGDRCLATPWSFFVLGCHREWLDMAKEAICQFYFYEPVFSVHPGEITLSRIYEIGVECYAAYAKAYFAGQKTLNPAADCVDWDKVSQAFVLPKKP